MPVQGFRECNHLICTHVVGPQLRELRAEWSSGAHMPSEHSSSVRRQVVARLPATYRAARAELALTRDACELFDQQAVVAQVVLTPRGACVKHHTPDAWVAAVAVYHAIKRVGWAKSGLRRMRGDRCPGVPRTEHRRAVRFRGSHEPWPLLGRDTHRRRRLLRRFGCGR